MIRALLIACLLASCNTNKNSTAHDAICNESKAIEIADKEFKRKGQNIKLYKREVIELSDSFSIIYILSDSTLRGGGANIKIAKKGCSIADKTFYQ